ncbi:unnamed protein product [Boreogadus saida]
MVGSASPKSPLYTIRPCTRIPSKEVNGPGPSWKSLTERRWHLGACRSNRPNGTFPSRAFRDGAAPLVYMPQAKDVVEQMTLESSPDQVQCHRPDSLDQASTS